MALSFGADSAILSDFIGKRVSWPICMALRELIINVRKGEDYVSKIQDVAAWKAAQAVFQDKRD